MTAGVLSGSLHPFVLIQALAHTSCSQQLSQSYVPNLQIGPSTLSLSSPMRPSGTAAELKDGKGGSWGVVKADGLCPGSFAQF